MGYGTIVHYTHAPRGAPAHGSPGIGFPLVSAVIGFLSSKRLISRAPLGLHQVISDYFVHRTSIPWPPSPCRRLSRPRTTMEPPTLWDVIGGLLTLTSIPKPPTFTLIRSTRWCRQRFCPTNPALRGILNGHGVNQVTHIILWAGDPFYPASVTFRFVHWPIRQGLEPGDEFPVGFNPLPFSCHAISQPSPAS
jgi:hypothetical protein